MASSPSSTRSSSPPTPKFRRPPAPMVNGPIKLNRDLMFHLQTALERDPEVDLASLIPEDYRDELAMYKPESPESSTRRYKKLPNPHYQKPLQTKDLKALPDLFEKLDRATTAAMREPLSDTVRGLLDQHSTPTSDTGEAAQSLAQKIKSLLRASDTLHESHIRGVVFNCGEEIAAKVCSGLAHAQRNYSAMGFLAENAPGVPAPRPHGMVSMGGWTITFMTYFPSTTLGTVWKELEHDQKLSIQHQLDEILGQMRNLRREDGQPLGSIHNGLVEDVRAVVTYTSDKSLKTGAEHRNFVFDTKDHESWPHGIKTRATESWNKFLRSFLPPPPTESVFSHGDFVPDNVIVDADENGNWTVTGIVDWEDSGFYPEYHESMKATTLLSPWKEDDWYLFMPRCIAPTTYPVEWLVDRIWAGCIGIHG